MTRSSFVAVGMATCFLCVVTVCSSTVRASSDSAYASIADEFDAVAGALERGTTAKNLQTAHRQIGAEWTIASPNLNMDKMLSSVTSKTPPRDEQERADRLVAMGQLGIAISIGCMERGQHPNPRKTAGELRDLAQQLRGFAPNKQGDGFFIAALSIVIAAIVFVVVMLLYFLPTIIAGNQRHSNVVSIFVVNLFLGWTLVGWTVALAWALIRQNKPKPMSRTVEPWYGTWQKNEVLPPVTVEDATELDAIIDEAIGTPVRATGQPQDAKHR